MNYIDILYGVAAMVCAFLIAFTTTPAVRVLAYKIGAIDIPTDNRRMHKTPFGRLGNISGIYTYHLRFCRRVPYSYHGMDRRFRYRAFGYT